MNGNPFSGQALQVYGVTILFYSVVYMVLMILPFYALSLGASRSEIGWIIGITMLASMVARPIAGGMIDRHGAGAVFLTAVSVFAISLAGYFLPSLWMLGSVRLVQGIVAAFFSTAMEIIIIQLLADRVRGQGISLYALATVIPTTFGPALALLLKDSFPLTWIFSLFLAMGAGTFICALRLAREPFMQAATRPGVRAPGLWKGRALVLSSVTMMLVSVANGAIFTFLPLHLEASHAPYGWLYFLVQTLVLAGCRFAGRSRMPGDGTAPTGLLLLTSLLAAAGSGLLAEFVSLPVLLLAAVCNGVAFALLYPALLTFVSFSVPEQGRAFLLALFIGAADLGFALGALAMGPLAHNYSYRIMYLACAALCVLACCVFLLGHRRQHLLPGAA